MKKVRRVLLLTMGLALMALAGVWGAEAAPPEDATAAVITAPEAPAAGEIAAAGKPSECECEDELTCSCACSPLAGAWIASLWPKEYEKDAIEVTGKKDGKDEQNGDAVNKKVRPLLKTFKFAPVNDRCDKFVVNAQAVTRPTRVSAVFHEVTDLTEFVGIACKGESKEVNFTALSYGVQRNEGDKVIFIAVLSGTVALPDERGKDGYYSVAAEKGDNYKCKCCRDGCKDSTCSCRTGDYDAPDRHGHPGQCCCCKDGCKYNDCECKSGNYGKDSGKDQGKDSGKDQGKDQGKDYGKDDGKYWGWRECEEPEKLSAELTVAFFSAEQDEDGDGFPDKGEKPIVCLPFKATLKRVVLQPQCKPTDMVPVP